MYARSALVASLLLLGSAALDSAAAQTRGVRGAGWRPASGDRAGGGRVAAPPSRPSDPRSGGWTRGRERVDTPPTRPGTRGSSGFGYGYGGSYHRPWRHGHGHHHGACFGHHGLHVGAHFGSAFVILVGGYAYPTYTYVAPYSVRYSAGGSTTLLQGDLGDAADALTVDRLAGGVVRLTWRGDGRAVEEVGLFLADSQQRVLAVQTLRAPPFAALFEPAGAAAYVGITIAYADGQNTTTLLPFHR